MRRYKTQMWWARGAGLALLLAALLSGCVVYVSPQEVQPVLTRFAPDRGEGGIYRGGQPISFTLRSERSGYLSLLVVDPDGSRYVLARNLPVQAGVNRVSGPTRDTRFVVVPPAGRHYVRAYFSARPVPALRQGQRAEADLAAYALEVAETSFVLR